MGGGSQEIKSGNKFVHGHNCHGRAIYTSNGKWSMKHDSYLGCETIKIKHSGYGYCFNCFIEIKGYMSSKDQYKIDQFFKNNSNINLKVLFENDLIDLGVDLTSASNYNYEDYSVLC